MQDFKRKTDWAFTGEGTVIRFEYGFTCFRGNGGPYFSITGEEWAAAAGDTPKPRDRDCVACGNLSSYIPKSLAPLRDARPFHLFDPTRGPMHYIANGIYWLEMADGTVARRESDPDPLETFKKHVLFGILPTDNEYDLESLIRVGKEGRTLWLENRLPALCEAFDRVVVEGLGLQAELAGALQFFEE